MIGPIALLGLIVVDDSSGTADLNPGIALYSVGNTGDPRKHITIAKNIGMMKKEFMFLEYLTRSPGPARLDSHGTP